jgi:hypothetical protein
MNDAMSAREQIGLTIVIYATLLRLFAWIVRTIRRGPHPQIHLRGRRRRTGGRR